MVPKRKGAIIRKIKDITLSSTLSLGLLAGTGFMQSCGNSNAEQEEYEVVFTKGMRTHIQETEKGVFKITDEQVVGEGESRAIVTFLNGQTDTLTLDQAKRIVETQADNKDWENDNQQTYNTGGYHGGGLGNVLMYGALGYYLGRSMNSRPNPGFYASPDVYSRAQQHTTVVQGSRVNKPVNASRGYFGTKSGSSSRSVGA
ncbi:hypothetical protein GXP67_32195 [Rhodocytophaga rosea]|uniref:UPF0323 domain-containing protein n=1 Tax=Rhodocytophaga rosea TaxID=2704465 RepID=A0A6C0GSC3_9BACT|nr:hypothetical protein [Rhodocytophaga rosea]QHT70979.1 hypothetical protein GXP67_32195 [Rhodocytophaga rosea]